MIAQHLEIAQETTGELILAQLNEQTEADGTTVLKRIIIARTSFGSSVSDIFKIAIETLLYLRNENNGIAGVVWIRNGVYKLESYIEINDTTTSEDSGAAVPISFRGDSHSSYGSVLITTTDDYSKDALIQMTNAIDVSFSNLTFKDVYKNGSETCKVFATKKCDRLTIRECYFENIGGEVIGNYESEDKPTTEIVIDNCKIIGAGKSSFNSTTEGTETKNNHNAIDIYSANDVQILHSEIKQCGSIAITLSSVGCFKIIGNTIDDNDKNSINGQGHGIYIANSDSTNFQNNIISNNTITNNGGNGIEFSYQVSGGLRTIVSNNIIINNGHHSVSGGAKRSGIYLGTNDVIVTGNNISANGESGILIRDLPEAQIRNIIIANNLIADNGGDNTYPADLFRNAGIGFGLPGNDTTWSSEIKEKTFDHASIKIINNDIQCNENQKYGIGFGSRIDPVSYKRYFIRNFEISGNTIYGSSPGIVFATDDLEGATADGYINLIQGIVRNNFGYRTEAAGISKIPKKSFQVTIEHGIELPTTPLVEGFSITPNSDILGKSTFIKANSYWLEISSINENYFTVCLRNKMRTDFSFSWKYEVPIISNET